jgi:hypothetical protein
MGFTKPNSRMLAAICSICAVEWVLAFSRGYGYLFDPAVLNLYGDYR